MRKAAVVILLLVLFVMVQSSFAGMLRSDEPEIYGASSQALWAILGGTAGFFAGGIPCAVIGAGLTAVINPHQGCSGCQELESPIVY
ncbi:MAG: hypothetical protein IJ697_04380 [Synergistaceae bacterium]|nr:hypothetical protein [Synergistaceae bacterium]